MSASINPTRFPDCASVTARFTATVDLPTPPLPDETAMMRPSSGNGTGVGALGRGWAGGVMTGSGAGDVGTSGVRDVGASGRRALGTSERRDVGASMTWTLA